MRILILGVTGMLGSTLFRFFSTDTSMNVFGTMRSIDGMRYFPPNLQSALIPNVNFDMETGLLNAFSIARPDIVINCVGIIKQQLNAKSHLESLAINAVLPHRLAKYCAMLDARLIHFSTDCVFSGQKGEYLESDIPDASDLYGRTKLLGEVDCSKTITLRTSIIGHELDSSRSLIDWFLNQSGAVKGFRQAIFSGLPTIEMARVIKDFVMPNEGLEGLYHLSVDPINKYDLLKLVASTYGKDICITSDDQLVINRSLNSERFRQKTGYSPRPWLKLVQEMRTDYLGAW